MSDNIANYEAYKAEQEEIRKLLNSEGGKALRRRLAREWNPEELFGEDPHQTTYKVAKRDAFYYIESLATQPERK